MLGASALADLLLGAGDGTSTPVALDGFSAGIRASMSAWAPEGSDFDLYNMALASMFATVHRIVEDVGSPDEPDTYQAGWSILLNPDVLAGVFPVFLPWLALFVGAGVPIGAPPSAALQSILGEQGFGRGQGFAGTYDSTNGMQGGAIITAAQSQLSGSQNVTLIERVNGSGDADAYAFVLIVSPAQVVSLSALEAAVAAAKPGGVMFTVVEQDAWTWAEAENNWSADTMTWAATASTRP